MTRFVIYSDTHGVYLGSCMGLGFWSAMDPCGQDAACTFASETDAAKCIASWDQVPEWALRTVAVDPTDGTYATINDCVLAGLPAWDPNATMMNGAP